LFHRDPKVAHHAAKAVALLGDSVRKQWWRSRQVRPRRLIMQLSFTAAPAEINSPRRLTPA
jgi:hypothetical protein